MSTNEPRSSRLRPSPDAVAQRLGAEMVLVHLKTDRIFNLNPTGARIWELLSAGQDRVEIERRLLEEFDVTAAQVAGEVDRLVHALRAERLLVEDDGVTA